MSCCSQVNNTIQVNSVDVPTSDLMATNGVIHVVKNVLYPPGEQGLRNPLHGGSYNIKKMDKSAKI